MQRSESAAQWSTRPRLWNALPYINLNLSFNKIKDQIFGYLWKHFIDHFVDDNTCSFQLVRDYSSGVRLSHVMPEGGGSFTARHVRWREFYCSGTVLS